jgi:hypothetical protein
MIANEYNLVVILLSLVFLGRRIRHRLIFSIALFLLILTSESGVFVALSLLVDSALSRNRFELKFLTVSSVAGFLALFGFHKNYAGSAFAFVQNAVASRQLPFKQMMQDAMSIAELRHFHGMYGFYAVPILAGAILIVLDRAVGLPIMAALIWAASRPGSPTFDCAAPLETFAVLLGFDMLISSAKFKTALWALGPVYVSAAVYLASLYLRNSAMYNAGCV